MDANRIYRRAGIIRDPRAKYEWLVTLTIAASCCWYPGCLRVDTEVNHIIGGHGRRSDEPCNMSLLCAWHHRALHSQNRVFFDREVFLPLKLGQILWLKKSLDPGNWDYDRLCQLLGHQLPELEAA